jgi:hypothetical protein
MHEKCAGMKQCFSENNPYHLTAQEQKILYIEADSQNNYFKNIVLYLMLRKDLNKK